MSASTAINGMRWTARGLGVLFLGVCVVIAVGEGLPNVLTQPPRVQVGFFALALILAGYVVGWWRELAGGGLTVAGWVLFVAAVRATFRGPYFFIGLMLVPGLLFLASAWLRRRCAET